MPKSAAKSIPENDALSTQLVALSHPVRREILKRLSAKDCCCCGDVVKQLPLAQSTVSQHLKILVSAGLVDQEIVHPRTEYSLNIDAVNAVSDALKSELMACCKQSPIDAE